MKVLLPEAIIMIFSEIRGVSHEMVRSRFLNYSRDSASATMHKFTLDLTSEGNVAAWANLVRCSSLMGELMNYFLLLANFITSEKRLIFNRKLLGFLCEWLNDIRSLCLQDVAISRGQPPPQVKIGRFSYSQSSNAVSRRILESNENFSPI